MAKKKAANKPIIETIEDPPATSEPAAVAAAVPQMASGQDLAPTPARASAPKGDLLDFLKAVQAVGGIEKAQQILNVVAKLK